MHKGIRQTLSMKHNISLIFTSSRSLQSQALIQSFACLRIFHLQCSSLLFSETPTLFYRNALCSSFYWVDFEKRSGRQFSAKDILEELMLHVLEKQSESLHCFFTWVSHRRVNSSMAILLTLQEPFHKQQWKE